METFEVALGGDHVGVPDRAAEVSVLGPEKGRPVLYFHSPSTSGEELSDVETTTATLGLRLITLKRPSTFWDRPNDFIDAIAADIETTIDTLALDQPAALAWSGGAPYALAAAARVGSSISSLHLVSPVPGPLKGPDAIPHQSNRLRQVANTTASSSWATRPEVLRDYLAIAAPWTFDVRSVAQPTTIWAPSDDEIVPPHLAEHLAQMLPDANIREVPGSHDWILSNWSTVLDQIRT